MSGMGLRVEESKMNEVWDEQAGDPWMELGGNEKF